MRHKQANFPQNTKAVSIWQSACARLTGNVSLPQGIVSLACPLVPGLVVLGRLAQIVLRSNSKVMLLMLCTFISAQQDSIATSCRPLFTSACGVSALYVPHAASSMAAFVTSRCHSARTGRRSKMTYVMCDRIPLVTGPSGFLS